MHPNKSDWLNKSQLYPCVIQIPLEMPKAQTLGDLVVSEYVVRKDKERSPLMSFVRAMDEDSLRWNEIEVFRKPVQVEEGFKVTRIHVDGTLWMSDSPQERYMMHWAAKEAQGDVLVGGCGLGMYAQYCLLNPKVKSITLVDINQDVLRLSEQCNWFQHPKMRTPNVGDIAVVLRGLEQQNKLFDTVYLDVHPRISTDYLPYLNQLRVLGQRVLTPKSAKAYKGKGRVYVWAHKKLTQMFIRDIRATMLLVDNNGFYNKEHYDSFAERFPIEAAFIKYMSWYGIKPWIGKEGGNGKLMSIYNKLDVLQDFAWNVKTQDEYPDDMLSKKLTWLTE